MPVSTAHKANANVTSDRLTLTYEPDPDGAIREFVVVVPDDSPGNAALLVKLAFVGPSKQGLTNEVLLAMVYERLMAFQAGPTACEENAKALRGVRSALDALHARTHRMLKMSKEETPDRVRVEDYKLYVGEKSFSATELNAGWGAWPEVEAACKRLPAPLTPAEMAVISGVATTQAAKNGFSELRQALEACGKL